MGGGLLLITVLVDDILGGLLDALHIGFDSAACRSCRSLLGFIAMFGVGGLFATQVLDLHGAPGGGRRRRLRGRRASRVVYLLFRVFRRAEGGAPFQIADLVGREGSVSVGDPGRPARHRLREGRGPDPRDRGDRRRGHPGAARRSASPATAGTGLVVDGRHREPAVAPTPARSTKGDSTVPDIFNFGGRRASRSSSIVIVLVLVVAYIGSRYKVAGANEALIVSGRRERGPRARRGSRSSAARA